MTDIPGVPEVTAEDLESYIGTKEAAAITGYSEKYIRDLCQRGQIPHYQHRPRAALLFLVSEVRAWLKEGGQ